jgi:hypothetical protein
VRATQNSGELPLYSHMHILLLARIVALIGIFTCLHSSPSLLRAAEKVEWKPVQSALLRVDDHPPKDWNLYTADKKNDRLLVQLGGRYLLVLVNQRQVYELDPAKLEHKDDTILWREDDRPSGPLPESGWITHDVGEAYRIHFRLDTEGRVFDIDIPHPVVIFGP